MLTSDFSSESLDKFVLRSDVYRYGVLSASHLRKHYLEKIEKKLSENTFSFDKFQKIRVGNFYAYRPIRLGDALVLRKLNDSIARIYKLRQADRSGIIRQTKVLLSESVQKHISKLDISSFYESIDRDAILERVKKDGLLTPKGITLLKLFFERCNDYVPSGLPRGVGLSATLAELVFRPIDEAVRRMEGVYYYARYVDDIVFFSISEPQSISQKIANILPAGMILNTKKSKSYFVGCKCAKRCFHQGNSCPCNRSCKCKPSHTKRVLNYLGYALDFENVARTLKKPTLVNVRMTEGKISRIKTRIIKALLDHHRRSDFELLFLRLRFLTENHRLNGAASKGKLKSGLVFNYGLMTDVKSLEDLDNFLNAQIFASMGTYGARLSASLSMEQRRKLADLSFLSGYESKRCRRLKPVQLKIIRRCW